MGRRERAPWGGRGKGGGTIEEKASPQNPREEELQVKRGATSIRGAGGLGDCAHLTVITLHVVVSVHGHHPDGGLTALEDETGFAREQRPRV